MASFDTELDALFRSSVKTAPPPPAPAAGPSSTPDARKKRKADATDSPARKSKRSKDQPSPAASAPSADTGAHKRAKRAKAKRAPAEPSDSDDDAAIEDAYAQKPAKKTKPAPKPAAKDGESSDSDSDSGADAPPPVHESLLPGAKRVRAPKKEVVKYVPPGETREQRDARTVFVGNVPVEVVKSKSGKKQLERHILSFAPSAKIESTRFRSVAFATPTGQSAGDAKEDARAHGAARASHWRAEQPEDKDAPARKKLTPGDKKRIAFVKGEVHEQAAAVHAYVVFAHADPARADAAAQMDPCEAARAVVEKGDGSVFLGRTLRVDAVAKGAMEARGDVRRTVFVGNLDFATKDEDLRVYFEGVVSGERGPPGAEAESDEEDESGEEDEEDGGEKVPKPRSWVRHVRVVRDKDTQLGKGFAYVEFADRECVDELLAMEEGKLKFAKRKLRLQRCKTLPGAAPIKKPEPKSKNKPAPAVVVDQPTDKGWKPRAGAAPISLADLPKGDPRLGERLAGLDKDARKAAKAADADRVARRLAKKKVRAKLALPEKGDAEGKKRVRERKSVMERKDKGGHKPVAKKGRIRSEKSVAKRNAKK